MTRRPFSPSFPAVLFFLLLTGIACTAAADPLPVERILETEVIPLSLPVFHDAEKAGVEVTDLFAALPAIPGGAWPCPDCRFAGQGPDPVEWKTRSGEDGFTYPAPPGMGVRYLAFFVTSDRWQEATFTVKGDRPVLVALDGGEVSLKDDETEEGETKTRTATLTLPIGKHLVSLRTLFQETEAEEAPDEADAARTEPEPWFLQMSVEADSLAGVGSLALSVTPDRAVDIQTILNAPRMSSLSVSPDGELVAVSLGEYRDGKHRENWLEVRATDDGALERYVRTGQGLRGVRWHPDGQQLSWQTVTEDAASIWLYDLGDGTVQAVLEDVKELGTWRWTPDGRSIVYEINRSPDADERKVKRVAHPADRQSWWRNRSHLMQVFVPGGLTRQLTAGPVSPQSWTLSSDSQKLLFFLSEPDLQNRPYFTSEMWLLDLATLAAEKLLDDPWVGGADFSRDGKTLCLRGSPSAFGGLGRKLPEGVQANDYGGQLYLFDLASQEVTPLTMDLVPDVGWFRWNHDDGRIYARCTDTQFSNVYRAKPGETWEKLDTGVEYTDQLALPRQGSTAVVRGTSATVPNKLFAVDLRRNRSRELHDPGSRAYRDVEFGKVERWRAPLAKGEDLDGFIYYPPHFDPSRKYPLIVYYYGGTSPVTRDFGGRYPKNIWAGQDFIVYVPEPSGATGYGQEFAARHVNDWGILTADEVIEATRIFLDTFDHADSERVGCIGASYGGFLTEYIITQTDIFAAAVSHAGISDISSYWGEGMWGYAYGARALAGSFPWQDRELFVEQSPLFHADKITTPLLLVHGDSDINVPKGESDQLFTALKLLGKDVEYVQIQGQDHHILDHDQRIVWNDTILAFFAKYLKDRPAWWDALYPEPEDYR